MLELHIGSRFARSESSDSHREQVGEARPHRAHNLWLGDVGMASFGTGSLDTAVKIDMAPTLAKSARLQRGVSTKACCSLPCTPKPAICPLALMAVAANSTHEGSFNACVRSSTTPLRQTMARF
jgi:hypothetical protein